MTEYGLLFSRKIKVMLLAALGPIFLFWIVSALCPAITLAGSSQDPGSQSPAKQDQQSIEEKWGIKVEAIRLSAAGYMLDFRYRIIDPDKAVSLTDRTVKPYLIDQASGAKLSVPVQAKVGPLRQTAKYGKPKVNRTYIILFRNSGGVVKKGSKVTVVIGDFRVENLTVE